MVERKIKSFKSSILVECLRNIKAIIYGTIGGKSRVAVLLNTIKKYQYV